MTGFEHAFEDAEARAAATLKAAQSLVSSARKMQKAARDGGIAALRRAQADLDDAATALGQEVAESAACWPYAEDEEERYLGEHFAAELRRVAAGRGLDIHERDGQLIAHPSIVHVLPGDRAVRVDRKKVLAIRPSRLADLLLQSQKKPGRYRTDRFLESLHAVYADIVRLPADAGRVVPLARIYKLLTALPGAKRDYDRTDFARDLYLLDESGPRVTRRGARVSFPASAGTRQSGPGLFTFVAPDGQVVKYYGIAFDQESAA